MNIIDYKNLVATRLMRLGFTADYLISCKMPLQVENSSLVPGGLDVFDRELWMQKDTLAAWQSMQTAASNENIELKVVSAFRSVEYQCELIQKKLNRGIDLVEILKVNAAPGFSEHHTGKALDLTTPDCEPLSESFELTEAFDWLVRNANTFHFYLSYPRNNPWNIVYEPWHWAWRKT